MRRSLKRALAPFATSPLRFPTRLWRVQIVDVGDGDTIGCRVDKGWEHFQCDVVEIRYASIDTWESRGNFPAEHLALGKQAAALNAKLCLGRWAYLLTSMDPEEYGRILGDPFPLQDDGTLSDAVFELYRAGFQKASSKYPYSGPTGGPRDVRAYVTS